MPAAPKASHTRKSGAPKAKGAVRAKSGCYTCRIRRKKCDEQQDDRHRCQTCVRLHLQCLGFGSKRPEWLRENSNVVELRDKIKSFLAAQGMIKGHSGSGPKNADNEPRILQLTEDHNHSSSSESPQSRSVSIPRDEYYRAPASSVRDIPWESAYAPGLTAYADSPGSSSTASTHHQSTFPMSTTSNSLVPSSHARRSSFTYNYSPDLFFGLEPVEEPFDAENGCYDNNNNAIVPYIGQYTPAIIDGLVKHYMENVIDIQYLLGDKKNLHEMIFQALYSHGNTREAVELLASVHHRRFRKAVAFDWETDNRLTALRTRLTSAPPTTNDAMAALHIVSLYLFDGGRGAWSDFLNIAAQFVDNVLNNPLCGPAAALFNCNPTVAFVIKTAIWFDVIASITTQSRPHFAAKIDEMFYPSQEAYYSSPQFSMISPMGCENNVLWALSQTSELSCWKREQERKGSLSVPELVKKAKAIEVGLNYQVVSIPLSNDDNTDISRRLTSEIFHKSTQLFLQSVVSGDHPNVLDLKNSVEETIKVIRKLLNDGLSPTIVRSVVRSTVFAFYICGALTDNETHRNTLLRILGESGDDGGVGNCSSIRTLLEDIWRNRTKNSSRPVDWRGKLKDGNSQILLV